MNNERYREETDSFLKVPTLGNQNRTMRVGGQSHSQNGQQIEAFLYALTFSFHGPA